MGLLSKLFRSKKDSKKGPPEQELDVYFVYGSTNFQHVYALEDLVQHAISEASVGHYEGHDLAEDGSDVKIYLYGPDAEAIFRVVEPLLSASPLMRGATVTLWFGPRGWRTPKRVVQLLTWNRSTNAPSISFPLGAVCSLAGWDAPWGSLPYARDTEYDRVLD